MRKLISAIAVLAVILAMACPAFAASEFVPSIPGKGAPDIVPIVDDNGDPAVGELIEDEKTIDYVYEDCLLITPVSEAEESELIPEDARELLLDLYEELKSGESELPYDKFDEDLDPNNMVIRDLFDISLLCEEHPEELAKEGVYLEITLDLGVKPDEKIYAMSYLDGEWVPVVSLINNGDGTVTLQVEDVGPLSLSVQNVTPPSGTGDTSDITLWLILMGVSAAALVVLIVMKARRTQR